MRRENPKNVIRDLNFSVAIKISERRTIKRKKKLMNINDREIEIKLI